MNNKQQAGRKRLYTISALALLTALIIVLGLTPLGLIPLGFIYVTILCVPVILGTLYLGLKPGLFLGFAFGAVSFYTALTRPSTLVAPLISASLPLTTVMIFLPRLCVPAVAWLIYQLTLNSRFKKAAPATAAVCGSLTNTVLYLGLMLLFYVLCGIDTASVLALIAGTAAIAGLSEAAVAAILVTPILAAVRKIKRKT